MYYAIGVSAPSLHRAESTDSLIWCVRLIKLLAVGYLSTLASKLSYCQSCTYLSQIPVMYS